MLDIAIDPLLRIDNQRLYPLALGHRCPRGSIGAVQNGQSGRPAATRA